MQKKIYRSESDRKIAGVCGGVAEFFGIDSTIVRIIWAIMAFCYGAGIVPYIICALVIPNESEVEMVIKKRKNK